MVYLDAKGRVMVKGNYDDEVRMTYEGSLQFDVFNHNFIYGIIEEMELAK
jgi:hypothetical protein